MGYKRHWMLIPEPQLEDIGDELLEEETWFPDEDDYELRPMPLDVQGFLFTLSHYLKRNGAPTYRLPN